MESKRLDNAALAAGISPNYINAHGKPQSISAETKRRLLDAMHQRTATKVAVTPVPNVMVYTSGKKMPMVVEGSGEYSWLLTTEEGTQYKGHVTGGKAFNLPTKLPEGYHTLTLTQDDQRAHCRVIVAPKRCYEPQALLNKQKLWGACVQLYTLRSEKNWGIGDFGDLKAMLVDVAKRGDNFEVIVIENNSTDPATFAYYKDAEKRYEGLKVVTWPEKGFNFSAINNFGRKAAQGEYLLLLNNDVEVRNGDWLTELLRQCAHPGGAAICGAMLYYPDETLQHAGVVTGLGGYAGHSHKYKKAGGSGYLFRAATVQDFSAVTGACLLVRTSVWDEVKGLDEKFAVAFNDVDFCLRVRDKGYRIVWTPYAQLTHYESKSRGGDEKDPVKAARFAAEQQRLYDIHGKADILDDPYYNPSLTRDREDFSESGDLRNLKEGKVTVRWRNA